MVMEKKLGLKSTVWSRRKKETFNQNRRKREEFKKMRRCLGISGTALNNPISESWGCQKKKRKSKKLKIYLKK